MPSFRDPNEIKFDPDRFRLPSIDDPGVIDIANSIKEVGQLQAILIDANDMVTDGFTRIQACKRLERDVWVVTEEEGKLILDNPLLKRVAEFQANVRRRDFTPIERSKAIAEIDRLMRQVYGEKKPSPGSAEKEGWTVTDTADKLGFKSHRTVVEAIAITKAAEQNIPGVSDAKTLQEATAIVKKAVRLEAAEELAKRRTVSGYTGEIEDPFKHFGDRIILGNCLQKMKELPNQICNLFVTDPPWGIDMDDAVADRGSASMKATGMYQDGEEIIPLLEAVIKEMYRIAKQDCYVVFFCGVRHWLKIAEAFKEAGFAVYSKMLIWVKLRSYDSMNLNISRSHAPAIWPNSAYDAMILARKGQPLIYKMGQPDVFMHPPVPSNERMHQAQKPLALMEDIISRFYHPGSNPLLIDPFAGSGSTLTAARRLGITQYFGYELDPINRERAISEMVNQYMSEQEQKNKVSSTTINLEDFE